MTPADEILKNFNLFVDGRGYAGNIEEFTPPTLSLVVDDHRGGGMDTSVEVDMGMEKLEVSFSMTKQDADVLKSFGGVGGSTIPVTARGALQNLDGTVTPVVLRMRGKIRSIEPGTWKPGEKATKSVSMGLTYYEREQGGEIIHKIDVLNMIREIGGVDQLADIRAAMGM